MIHRPLNHPFRPAGTVQCAGTAVQCAGTATVFAPQARIVRPAAPAHIVPDELMPGPGGSFQMRSTQRRTLAAPDGTFNFVRVQSDTPRGRSLLISARLPHSHIAAGRPVVYAGTARFERGEIAWWSNYSGTYQPIAAFRAQAGLPDDKFVPWQNLQMGGIAMQRGMFIERRAQTTDPAPKPERKPVVTAPPPPVKKPEPADA